MTGAAAHDVSVRAFQLLLSVFLHKRKMVWSRSKPAMRRLAFFLETKLLNDPGNDGVGVVFVHRLVAKIDDKEQALRGLLLHLGGTR